MNSWARRGAKVVCAFGNGIWRNNDVPGHKINGPKVGDTVTILDLCWTERGLYLEFAEWPGNRIFTAKAFRPPVARPVEQDVALFAHHLATAPALVTERVSA